MRTYIGLLFCLSLSSLWSQTVTLTAKLDAQQTAATEQGSATATGDPTQQLLSLEDAWVAAELKHDGAALQRMLHERFVVTFGAGRPHGKDAFINSIVSDEVDATETQTLSDRMVIIDRDTGIVVGTDTLRGTRNGAPYTMTARYTATYILRNGQWVALAEHLVEVPAPK